MRYNGHTTNLGRWGVVKAGDMLVMCEAEAAFVKDDARFTPIPEGQPDYITQGPDTDADRRRALAAENETLRVIGMEFQSWTIDRLRDAYSELFGVAPSRFTGADTLRSLITAEVAVRLAKPQGQHHGPDEPLLHDRASSGGVPEQQHRRNGAGARGQPRQPDRGRSLRADVLPA